MMCLEFCRKVLIAACFALLFVAGTSRPAAAHDAGQAAVDVVLQGQPAAPYEAAFTANVIPGRDGALLLRWTLAPGAELLDGPGEATWPAVVAHVPVMEARRIRVAGPGVYAVAVGAALDAEGARYVGGAVIYIVAAEDGTVTLALHDPNKPRVMGSAMAMTVEQEVDAAAPRAPAGDPCFKVAGRVLREEHTPDTNGYRPMVMVPVRSALVEMREEDTFFDDSYGETLTDANGFYSFSFCDDDGIFDDELELYVRLTAELRSQGRDVVEVQEDGLYEDVYEFNSGIVESEGGSYTVNFDLNREQSAIFNIADAILDAWTVWNANGGAVGGDAIFGYQAEVNWEDDDEDDKTFYNGYVWDEITIADSNSNPDEWDDSVIIHEWTHQADDNYGCDDNPGGEHSSREAAQDLELAFAEGFANYYQSAVRNAVGRPAASYYLDGLGPGGMMGGFDLESRDEFSSTLNTVRNEAAVAALLWDLEDLGVDKQDRTGFGLRTNQQLFTHPTFAENGDIFDDTCTTTVYLTSWRDVGNPTNRDVAAIIQQNVGIANFFSTVAAASAPGDDVTASVPAAGDSFDDFKWWKNLTWIVDNSASMAASGKLSAVKTVMKEQVNDLAPAPKGTEFNVYTFNNTASGLQQPVARKFYEDLVNPEIDALGTVAAPDADCTVAALQAMAQGAQRQSGGDIWLYTDRATSLAPTIENMKRLLNQRQIKGSFAMLGGCAGVLPAKMSDVTGGEINYLGNAANGSQSTGIVPYLLTALGSGGQFIYVREDQLGSAADILRAQVANSAGAGKWSDYVSDSFTYRWDRLEAGEYQWFPAESLGQAVDQIPQTGYLTYNLPDPFPYYGATMDTVGINQDGIVEFEPCASPCPIIRFTRYFLDNLATDMQWGFVPFPPRSKDGGGEAAAVEPAAEPAAVQGVDGGDMVFAPDDATACQRLFGPANQRLPGPEVCVFQANLGFEWHIISVQGYALDGVYRAYQIWLNKNTGEIRYQYDRVRNESATAEIGLRRTFQAILGNNVDKLLVSNADIAGAYNGMGYKFTPAPPQPTRTYTVAVDGLMEGVGFLQTGYSGRFEPMIVRDPAGNPVNCADTANVLCVTMNNVGDDRMVQYVQVNVNGSVGDWTATVDAQAGAEGTFTFSALAASSIQASTLGDRDLPMVGAVRLAVKLGQAADGNQLQAWLQRPNGVRFGSPFVLYDDGAHGDGRAGDGVFSLPDFTAPGKGVGYLWVQGAIGGAGFVRSDPVPYNFQPLEVTALIKEIAATGSEATVPFRITNHDSVTHCYAYGERVSVPDGWSYYWTIPPGDDGSEQLFGVCIGAGATIDRELIVLPSGPFLNGPALAGGEITAAFVEIERGAISDSDSATVIRYRPVDKVTVLNPLSEAGIRPNGVDTATLTVQVYDALGAPVQDGTYVDVTTDLGAVGSPGAAAPAATGVTKNGRVIVTFTAGTEAGDATVTAAVGGKTATTVVPMRAAAVETIDLTASPVDLSQGAGAATLAATVRDTWGDPIAGAAVRIGVSDDSGTQGSLSGAEVVTGTTDAAGLFAVAFVKAADATGQVEVRAEYLVVDGGAVRAAAYDQETIILAAGAGEQRIFLPAVRK